MALLKIAVAGAVGAVGFVLYQTWQRQQAAPRPATVPDEGLTTTPHGDPILVGARLDAERRSEPRPAAQSSRGFGEP